MVTEHMKTPPLRSIYFYASGDCNLKCRHCWIEPTYSENSMKITPWKSLKPIFEEAIELGLRYVKLTGGEPCLHPEIDTIIHELGSKNLFLGMETNATLLTNETVRLIKETNTKVAVSLDGPDRESHEWLRGVDGAWDLAMNGMQLLKKYGIPFQIICSLHKGNINKFHLMPDLVEKLGGTSLKVNPVTGTGRSEIMKKNNELIGLEELLKFYNNDMQDIFKTSKVRIHFDIPPAFRKLTDISKQKFGVCGIFTILGLLHDGSTGLCGIGEKVGELNFGCPGKNDLSLKDIWTSNPVLKKIRENVPDNLGGICSNCKMKHYCIGKCMANTFVSTGDLLNGFPFCEEADRLGMFPDARKIKKS